MFVDAVYYSVDTAVHEPLVVTAHASSGSPIPAIVSELLWVCHIASIERSWSLVAF